MVWVLDLDGGGRELLLPHVIASWSGLFMMCRQTNGSLAHYLAVTSVDFAFDLNTTWDRAMTETKTSKHSTGTPCV